MSALALLQKSIKTVILAGGLSSRMGETKALLPHNNGRLIDFVALQCQFLGLEVYSQQLGFRRGANERVEGMYTEYTTEGERVCNNAESSMAKSIYVSGAVEPFICIPDLVPQLGPMGGIISAALYFKSAAASNKITTIVLFVPVDLPYLTSSALRPLIDFFHICTKAENHAICEGSGSSAKSIDAVIYQHNPLPLALSLNDNVYYQLDRFFKTTANRRSVRSFLATINTHTIHATKEQLLAIKSTNTKDEWQAFKEQSLS